MESFCKEEGTGIVSRHFVLSRLQTRCVTVHSKLAAAAPYTNNLQTEGRAPDLNKHALTECSQQPFMGQPLSREKESVSKSSSFRLPTSVSSAGFDQYCRFTVRYQVLVPSSQLV